MKIDFIQQGTNYVAEFSVKGNFNVHLELTEGSRCNVYVKTTEQGDYTLERAIRKEMTSYDFDVEGDNIATRWYMVRVAYPAVGTVTEIKTMLPDRVEFEEVKRQIAELSGDDPKTETAQTPQIDNNKEIYGFLEGYDNTHKLKDVMPKGMTDEEYQAVKNLIK